MKTILLSMVVVASLLFSSCGDSVPAKNYFSETGLTIASFSNPELNHHLKDVESLYNQMADAAEKNDKEAVPRLSVAFSDWILKALSFKESISAEEQKKFDVLLEEINSKWTEKKDKLL